MNALVRYMESMKIPDGEWPSWPDKTISFEDSRAPIPTGTVGSQSRDKHITSGMWSIEPCVVNFKFPWDEFNHILEGEAVVEDLDTGRSINLGPGCITHFEMGCNTRWTVTRTIRKYYVIRTSKPLVL